jgi:ABC-type branched-subunit amino acid transport system substrate-binding protein
VSRRSFALVSGLAFGLVVAPAARGLGGNAPVVLGLLLPPEEPAATGVRQGVLAAVAEANEGGNAPVRLAVRGRQGPWGSDASEAARLVMDDGAGALLAPPGGAASHLVLQVSGRTGVPVASLCPDASVTQTALTWMVRVVPSNLDEARAIFEGSPNSRWLAFVPAGRAGREAAGDLKRAAGRRHLIADSVETAEPLPDVTALKSLLSSAHPDGVLLWLDPVPAGRVARTLRSAGFSGTLAGPLRLASGAFAAEAGAAAEGLLVPALPPDRDGARAAFEKKYRALFGADPDPAAVFAHDAAALLIGIVRKSGAEEARRAFPMSESVRGASGLLKFDSHGNRVVALGLLRYHDGRL